MASQQDLLTAQASSVSKGEDIDLQFSHVLSAIKFHSAKYGSNADLRWSDNNVAGSVSGDNSAPGIFGTAWDTGNTANDMRQHPTKTDFYYLVKEVTVQQEGTFAFKVVKNRNRSEEYP